MLTAWGPRWPSSTSNSTFWPSSSDLNPSDWIAEKCANKSWPSSEVIKPNPFKFLSVSKTNWWLASYFLTLKIPRPNFWPLNEYHSFIFLSTPIWIANVTTSISWENPSPNTLITVGFLYGADTLFLTVWSVVFLPIVSMPSLIFSPDLTSIRTEE